MKKFKVTVLQPIFFCFPLIILIHAQLVFATEKKIEAKIYEELNSKEQARVVIILKDDYIKGPSNANLDVIKERVKEKQKKVLKILSRTEFKILNKYKTVNALSGFITQKGIKKLENNPDIERVYLDKKVHAILSESLPLIKADMVHALGYTGKNITVCIPDTGVDYTHPDLGNPICSISPLINGITETHSLESAHPYGNNSNIIWTITKPGYSNIAVHFERIDVEKNWDFLYVLDANGNIIQMFTGSYNDVWSIAAPGDTIKIQLVTDGIIKDWGFRIDQVLNGTTESVWSNCGNIIGGYDFVNNDHDPFDDNNHGSHVSGIIASQNATYQGIAPDANIAALKVLDANGSGWFSNTAAAIDWCIENKDTYAISVISMSLGDGGEHNTPAIDCDPFATAIAISTAVSQGIFVAVASGNEAYKNGISYPACSSDAFSVGGVYDADLGNIGWGNPLVCRDVTTAADKIVCHTNRDEILDVLAPGALITSTVPSGFATFGGTSMATPHAAGVTALLLEKNSSLTPEEIKTTLQSTGQDIFDTETGLTFPRIDALAAINAVCAPTQEICDDGLDNDCDGLTDLNDPDCQDSDNDGVPDNLDNCSAIPNGTTLGTCSPGSVDPGAQCTSNSQCSSCAVAGICSMDQEDADSDGFGDVCDNCLNNCNDQQLDADVDGIGDVCDDLANDGCGGGCSQPQCEQEC